jgi:hypothetical protein
MPTTFYFELIECLRFKFGKNSFEFEMDSNLGLNQKLEKKTISNLISSLGQIPLHAHFPFNLSPPRSAQFLSTDSLFGSTRDRQPILSSSWPA